MNKMRLLRWALVALGISVLVFAVLWERCGLRGCPDVNGLRARIPDEASILLDRDGNEISKLYVKRRIVVPTDSIAEVMQDAIVAIEDRRFREHNGVDWVRVAGASWQNVKTMGISQGSSTITMQLARNAFPERLPAQRQTLWRKLGEARVAMEIEKRYTKNEILGLYLNFIYFGSGAYGIEAAAQEYFGKPALQLNLPEAAMLAALPRAPSRYNPRTNPKAALDGRSLVLGRMLDQGLITPAQADSARNAKLELRTGNTREKIAAQYFTEAVRRELQDRFGDEIYSGGFKVHTTLDMEAQRVLEEELERQAHAVEAGQYGRFRHATYAMVHADSTDLSNGTPYLQVAAILMDAKTGDVLALVGGRDFHDSKFNRVMQAQRQPGSAFKPFVYAAALRAGLPPTHPLEDEPTRMVINGRVWEPKNYDGTYSGMTTLREGLVHSKNVATVRLANEIDLRAVVQLAKQMGLASVPEVPSIVLGTAEVTPIALTASYAAFATLGSTPTPRLITRVLDRFGTTLWESQPQSRQVLDPPVAFVTTTILRDVIDRGTGTAVRGVGYRGPAAGKTGTTQDAADVWFVGFTPTVVGTIWMGLDQRETIVPGATGGAIAAPVWGRVMRRLGYASENWRRPAGVESGVVDVAGNVMAAGCTGPDPGVTRHEHFLRGTMPLPTCAQHAGYPAWPGAGGIDRLTPDSLRHERSRDLLRAGFPDAVGDTTAARRRDGARRTDGHAAD
ncbi:MAG: transglycosylase domain-containing protein, partial [Longimicrobiales bacterium]